MLAASTSQTDDEEGGRNDGKRLYPGEESAEGLNTHDR